MLVISAADAAAVVTFDHVIVISGKSPRAARCQRKIFSSLGRRWVVFTVGAALTFDDADDENEEK